MTINNLPPFKSPLNNLWHGGLEYIYPEDRVEILLKFQKNYQPILICGNYRECIR